MKLGSKLLSILCIALFGPLAMAAPVNVVLTEEDRAAALQGPMMEQAFQEKMDVVSGSKRIKGNDALILLNGKQSYPVRYTMIDKAQKSIVLSTFSFYGKRNRDRQVRDSASRAMVEKLIKAKNERGVEILVIVDGGTSVLSGGQSVITDLRKAGIKVIKYNPIVGNKVDFALGWALPHATFRLLTGQDPVSNRWHEKTMIIDGKWGIIGGLNWGELYRDGNAFTTATTNVNEFFNEPLLKDLGVPAQEAWGPSGPNSWRDTDLLIKGPVLEEAQQQLLFDFAMLEVVERKAGASKFKDVKAHEYAKAIELYNERYKDNPVFFNTTSEERQNITGGIDARYISQRPYLERKLKDMQNEMVKYGKENDVYVNDRNPMLRATNWYVNTINMAQKQIIWGCHSNRPLEDVGDALLAAANRGVQVILMNNSKKTAKHLPDKGLMMYQKSRRYYREMLTEASGNIRLYEWQRNAEIDGEHYTSGAFHSKAFSVDGIISSIGSYNISKASTRKHTEGTMVIYDAKFAEKVEKMFQADLQFAKEFVIEDLPKERTDRRRRKR